MNNTLTDFLRRLRALVHKEFLQLLRDNSSILIGAVLPIALIILIGGGISLDVKHVPIAVVMEENSPTARDSVRFLDGSAYYAPQYVTSMREADEMMRSREVDAILVVPPDFSVEYMRGEASIQLILYGVDAATASSVQGYIEASLGQQTAQGHMASANGRVQVESRIWFNDENNSTWYFVPGLMMLIMTIVGVFLTALSTAREWERGTLEAIFVTPMRLMELLLSKIIPYFCVAFFGLILSLAAAHYIYHVPVRGSLLIILLASILYLFVSLGIGLVISAITKSQFLACQAALIVSFLPSLMLTGFLYDLRCVPEWIAAVGRVLPPTYYLELLKSLLLTGNYWPLIGKNCTMLFCYAVFFLGLALKFTKKRVE